jgi:hypothetical protein
MKSIQKMIQNEWIQDNTLLYPRNIIEEKKIPFLTPQSLNHIQIRECEPRKWREINGKLLPLETNWQNLCTNVSSLNRPAKK